MQETKNNEKCSPEAKKALKKMKDIINLPPEEMKKKLDEIEHHAKSRKRP